MIIAFCILAVFSLLVMTVLAYAIIHLSKENDKLYETILRIENPIAVGALKSSESKPREEKPATPQPIYR